MSWNVYFAIGLKDTSQGPSANLRDGVRDNIMDSTTLANCIAYRSKFALRALILRQPV